ncbi:SHOCT domain-containing protein [Nocardioides carbamazepini]|uniref:SHOCT domain-containing protein n=1 Tax=Nocardioides carbamazepini TaxID=2854259 RepID=UPI00214A8486|nr:SHOCT domain-containing protein [Nocardioides carbamazepini]MCR1781230.1 SHOCT domain-containing protein [Nocardioides carbamazepini]
MTVAPRDVPKPPSLVGSVLPPVLFLLAAGVVGPIFLVMGLVSGGPEAGWLLPTGVGITALDVVIGLLLGRGRYRSAQKLYRLRKVGRSAIAEVLSFDHTGVRVNDQPMLLLKLRIRGADITPFEVQARETVPEIHLSLLHGGELPVLVDPESHEWEIDWDAARSFRPAAPTSGPTPADRLAELDDLLKRDLVSREEYDAARARILGGI